MVVVYCGRTLRTCLPGARERRAQQEALGLSNGPHLVCASQLALMPRRSAVHGRLDACHF
jgi:hypothetical protein